MVQMLPNNCFRRIRHKPYFWGRGDAAKRERRGEIVLIRLSYFWGHGNAAKRNDAAKKVLMRSLLVYGMLLLSAFASGQAMRFSHLDQKQGLSQNTAMCFLQDREGFIWVGTQDGLNRYDGYGFKVFRMVAGDTNSLCDNFILCLSEDAEGNIWIGTRNGICIYRKESGKFLRYYSPRDDHKQFHASVTQIDALSGGGIVYRNYLGELLKVRVLSGNKTESVVLCDSITKYAYCSKSNTLAVLKRGKISFCTPGGPFSDIEHEWKAGIRAPLLLLDENVLYMTDSNTVYSYPVWEQQAAKRVYSCDTFIICITQDRTGSLWLGTAFGVRLTGKDQSGEIRITENVADYFSLKGNRVEAIYHTKEDLVWVGTVGGVNVYDPLQTRFRNFYSSRSFTTNDIPVWFVIAFGQTTVWATDEGLNYNTSDAHAREWLRLLPQDLHYSCGSFDARGRLWLGTRREGILIVDTAHKTIDNLFFRHPQFATSSVMDFCEDGRGKMWIASVGTLAIVNTETLELHFVRSGKNSPLNTGYFSALARDEQNTMYVGTANGVAHFDLTDSVQFVMINDPADTNSLSYNIVNDIAFIDDKLWIATMGSGLDCYDPAAKTFTHFNTQNGLANNTIYGIEPEPSGKLWMSTNEGLVLLDPQNGWSRNYTMRDGLPSNEFVINKHAANAAEGTLYFGSSTGLVSFHPADFAVQTSDRKPVLTNLLINYNAVPWGTDSLLQLTPDQRNVTFEFTVVDFRNQDKLRYEYRLIGFDSAWHTAESSSRMAVFTNLPYGRYVFEVRYRISGENWSAQQLSIPFDIQTPFYATWWFRILSIVTGLIIVGLVVRYISQRKLRKQLEVLRTQEQIRNEKERISRDLHDNVGAQLTYVISSLDSISYAMNRSNGKESEKLEQLGEFARGTMDQLRESIWAINSEQISLAELSGKWKQFLSQLSETKDITVRLTRTGDECMIKPTIAIEIHRIVQEAVSNAFRHSGGTAIEVIVANNNPHLVVTVKDDGTGMPENPEKAGHYGLQNMKKRAETINGDLKIQSDEGGTRVTLSCNLL